MSSPLFGRTQNALQTPFEPGRNPGFGGQPQPFTSTESQSAIEEALSRAIANDRFLLLGHYGGNANVGRYLEWFPNQGGDISPIFLSASANILTVVLQTTAATATCTVGIFDLNVSSVTPVYSVIMTAQKRVSYTGLPLASVSANSLLAARVTSGTINSPTMQLIFSANT